MLITEIQTQTGARLVLHKHKPVTTTDEDSGAVELQDSYLLRITVIDPEDRRTCEVMLTHYELEELGAAVDAIKFLY